MASKTKQSPTSGTEYAQQFPNWVYQVPGALLILVGFGTFVFLSLT